MPRYSILLPTHNRANVLPFSIRSILSQTEGDFELLVVGDGCTDNTAQIVAQFSDPRVRYFDLPKAPFFGYANRNIALRLARGDLIAYAQDDDLMLPDHLARMGQLMENEIDWAYSRPLWVTTDGFVVPFGTNLLVPSELKHFLDVTNTIPSNCVVHRRECFDRVGFWPENSRGGGDWLLWKKIISQCGASKISYLPIPTTLHFRAFRKDSRVSGMTQIETWLRFIGSGESWPAVLRYSVPGGDTEQKVLFEALQVGGNALVDTLREATLHVIDRQCWHSIQHESQLHDARALLDAILASRSWRVTEPLRRGLAFLKKLKSW